MWGHFDWIENQSRKKKTAFQRERRKRGKGRVEVTANSPSHHANSRKHPGPEPRKKPERLKKQGRAGDTGPFRRTAKGNLPTD